MINNYSIQQTAQKAMDAIYKRQHTNMLKKYHLRATFVRECNLSDLQSRILVNWIINLASGNGNEISDKIANLYIDKFKINLSDFRDAKKFNVEF